MHLRGKGRLIAAMLLLAGRPALADCPPAVQSRSAEDVAARIDHYRAEPRAPETYRAQAGLGDPQAEPHDAGGQYWNASGEERALLQRMLPAQHGTELPYWYPDAGDCRLDYALSVARARIARFGADHPYVRQWLRAQQAVFSACRGEGEMAGRHAAARAGPAIALPPPLAASDPAIARLQRDDRAYQAASILFYRRDPAAARAFREIAASASPHAHIARYMLVAIQARDVGAASYNEAPEARAQRLAQARAAMAGARTLLADPGLADVHALAQGLIGFLGYWTGDDAVRTAQIDATLDALEAPLARIATSAEARERYAAAAADIVWLRRDVPAAGWSPGDSDPPAASSVLRALGARSRRDRFAAWLLLGVSPFEREPWIRGRYTYDSGTDAFSQRGDEGGRAAAVVRASFAAAYDPADWTGIDALIAETRSCPSDDRLAAVGALFYHQVRAALMYPAGDAGSPELPEHSGFAAALAGVEAWPWRSSEHHRELLSDMLQYLVAQGRIDEARTLRDGTDPRDDEQGRNVTALLLLAEDEAQFVREVAARPDGQQALVNLLPIATLARLAARSDLPAAVRARFARVAWARLYALQRPIPRGLDRMMRHLNSEITAGWTSRPGARPSDRALLLDVLRSPGLNILLTDHQRGSGENMGYADPPGLTAIDTFEHSDNNWWCAWQPDRHAITASAIMYGAFFRPESDWDAMAAAGATAALGPLLRSSWLWRAQDPAEQAALAAIPSAPRLLSERAIAWRSTGLFGWSPRADGQDEALALAVRSTRYGCQRQGGHRAYSRAAYELLHQRFPDSDAARRTRYWFDCAHFSGGCSGPPDYGQADWERWANRRWYY